MVSAALNVVVEMDSRLAALSRQDGADEDCVFGCLQAVLEDVPSPRVGQGYAEVLRDAGFCCVAALKLLLVEDLVALGVPLGHARLIVSVTLPDLPSVGERAGRGERADLTLLRPTEPLQAPSAKVFSWRIEKA